MLRLPDELNLLVAAQLQSDSDVSAYARTNRRLFSCIDDHLYYRDAQRSTCQALEWAVQCRMQRTATKAVEAGAKVSMDLLRTPCGLNDIDISMAKLLLDLGEFNEGSKDEEGWTPLWCAVAAEYDEYVLASLNSSQTDLRSRDAFGATLLHYAAYGGHEATVKLLLESATIDADTRAKNGNTPLTYAVWKEHEAIVKLLLDSGKVDVNSKDNKGTLSIAALQGNHMIAKLLLDGGLLDCNSMDESGMIPLSQAVAQGRELVARLLITLGKVDIDCRNKFVRTPL